MSDAYIISIHGMVAALSWLIVGCGATWAVFSKAIYDTTFERIGLSFVAITTFATTARIVKAGFVSEGGLALSVSLAVYVLALVCKHARAEKPTRPADKTKPAPLTGADR